MRRGRTTSGCWERTWGATAAHSAVALIATLSLGTMAAIASAESDGKPAPAPKSPPLNGFDLSGSKVPKDEVLEGGPPRDGISAVDAPEFVTPIEALPWLKDHHVVIGVAIGKEARAYPVHIMEYHQVVNDRIGGRDVVLTYDPLTDVARAFARKVGERTLRFGVSGLIHRAGFLAYDRETDSLWIPFDGRAISGPLAGRTLEPIPVRTELLGFWRRRHPETGVLVPPNPQHIDYRYSPFSAYWVSENVPFPLEHRDGRYHPKELVLGVDIEGRRRAYLGSIITRGGGRIVDEIAGRKLRIEYDTETGSFVWDIPESVEVTTGYWFAWKNWHPDTEIWQDDLPPSSN